MSHLIVDASSARADIERILETHPWTHVHFVMPVDRAHALKLSVMVSNCDFRVVRCRAHPEAFIAGLIAGLGIREVWLLGAHQPPPIDDCEVHMIRRSATEDPAHTESDEEEDTHSERADEPQHTCAADTADDAMVKAALGMIGTEAGQKALMGLMGALAKGQ